MLNWLLLSAQLVPRHRRKGIGHATIYTSIRASLSVKLFSSATRTDTGNDELNADGEIPDISLIELWGEITLRFVE